MGTGLLHLRQLTVVPEDGPPEADGAGPPDVDDGVGPPEAVDR